MRRLLTYVLLCVAIGVVGLVRSASADDSMMSGSMGIPKDHAYLLGNWNCTVNLPAMMGHGAEVDHGAMTISVSPMMTLRSHVDAKDYMSDSYEGYDMKTKTHWLTTSDTTGQVTSETSVDGKTFTGTTWGDGAATPIRDVQTKLSDTKIRDITTLKMNGSWSMLADATCIKS